MSAGTATDLVRDGVREGHDPPTGSASPDPPPKQHWIDVDRLERIGTREPLPWPLNRIPPSYPVPEPSRWRVVAAVALTCCSIFVTLALHFGQPIIPPPPLGRDETIGQVLWLYALEWGERILVSGGNSERSGLRRSRKQAH
jgi:hypothetical protein